MEKFIQNEIQTITNKMLTLKEATGELISSLNSNNVSLCLLMLYFFNISPTSMERVCT